MLGWFCGEQMDVFYTPKEQEFSGMLSSTIHGCISSTLFIFFKVAKLLSWRLKFNRDLKGLGRRKCFPRESKLLSLFRLFVSWIYSLHPLWSLMYLYFFPGFVGYVLTHLYLPIFLRFKLRKFLSFRQSIDCIFLWIFHYGGMEYL